MIDTALIWINGAIIGYFLAMAHLHWRLSTGRVAAWKIREWLKKSEESR